MRYLAISFEEDGTAFVVMPSAPSAFEWLMSRRVYPDKPPHGSQKIFELDGGILSMDYDSYGETHVRTEIGEARCVYDEDSQTVNEDVYLLGRS